MGESDIEIKLEFYVEFTIKLKFAFIFYVEFNIRLKFVFFVEFNIKLKFDLNFFNVEFNIKLKFDFHIWQNVQSISSLKPSRICSMGESGIAIGLLAREPLEVLCSIFMQRRKAQL